MEVEEADYRNILPYILAGHLEVVVQKSQDHRDQRHLVGLRKMKLDPYRDMGDDLNIRLEGMVVVGRKRQDQTAGRQTTLNQRSVDYLSVQVRRQDLSIPVDQLQSIPQRVYPVPSLLREGFRLLHLSRKHYPCCPGHTCSC